MQIIFRFQLDTSEFDNLKSQSVISSWGGISNSRYAKKVAKYPVLTFTLLTTYVA